jgi:hypothetical protein
MDHTTGPGLNAPFIRTWRTTATKKADVAEHQEVLDHVGLLSNEPPGSASVLSL